MKIKILLMIFIIFLIYSCTTYRFGDATNNFIIDETDDTNKDVHEFNLSYTYKVMGIPVKGDKTIVEDAFIHPDKKTMFLIISFPKIGILKTTDNGRTFSSNFFKSSFLDDAFGYNNDSKIDEDTSIKKKKSVPNRFFGCINYSQSNKDKIVISFGPYIFTSIDRGEKWNMKSIFFDLDKTNIMDIFVTDKDQIIVLTENTIAISDDWGKKWVKKPISIDKMPSYKIKYLTGFYDSKSGILYASIKHSDDNEELISSSTYEYFYNNKSVELKSGLYYSKDSGNSWTKSIIPVPVLLWEYSDKIYASSLYPLLFYKFNFDDNFKNSLLFKKARFDETTILQAQSYAKILLNLKPEDYDIVSTTNNRLLSFTDIEKDITITDEKNFDNLFNAIDKLQKINPVQWENYWYEKKKSSDFNYEYNYYKFFKLWTGYRTNSPVLYTKDTKKNIYYRIKPDPVFLKSFINYTVQNQIRLNSIKPFLKKTTDIEFFDPSLDPTNGFPVVLEYSKDKGKSWVQFSDSKHIRTIIDPLNSKRSGFYWYKNIDQKKIAKLQFSFGWTEGINYMIYPMDIIYYNNQLLIIINYFSVSKTYKDMYTVPLKD